MDDRTRPVTATTATAAAPTVTAPSTPPDPVATAPAATTPPADAPGEAQAGGAGDEEGIRIPVDLRVRAGAVTPASVAVPPFLPVEITATSGDGAAHRLVVAGRPLAVPASGSARLRLDGLRRGTYAVEVDGARGGELVAVDDVGP